MLILSLIQNRNPCISFLATGTSSSKGLSSHFWRSIFTNRFSLIKATRLDNLHPYFDNSFRYFRTRIVIRAVHICIITAFSLVPINDLICSNCFISLKNLCKALHKAFRMSKTDLRIRPIYHRLRHRIEAHICVSFTAYAIYKELERVLHSNNSDISINRARELSHTMYQITYLLPESKQFKTVTLQMDHEQAELCRLVEESF